MADTPGSDLRSAQLEVAASRLRIASYLVGAVTLASLAGGIVTGNYQPFAVMVALIVAVLASWLWSVAVDRAYHRLREWNRSQAPQPLTASRPSALRPSARYPVRAISSGPASLSLRSLLEQGGIPPVVVSAESADPQERIAALKMNAAADLSRLAGELERSGMAGEAEKLRRQAEELDPYAFGSSDADDSSADGLSRALGLARRGDYEGAAAALEDRARKGGSGAALYTLAICRAVAGDAAAAAELLRKAADTGVESAALRLALGTVLAEAGQYEEALRQLRAAAAIDPESAFAHAAMAEVELLLGQPDRARESAQEALSLDADLPLARCAVGRALYQLGDAPGAAREFGKALESDPANPDLLYNLAAALAAAGRNDQIIREIAPAAQDVQDPQIARIVGEAFEAAGQKDRAREFLTRTAELLPESEEARLRVARSLREEGRLEEARAAVEELVRDMPRSAAALTELGLLEEAAGDPGKALQNYRAAIQLDRTAPQALTHAGRLLLAQGQVKEALNLLKQAAALPGATAETYHWLGEAHLASGKALLAIEALREAARQSETPRGETGRALGRALLMAGRARDALEELRRARKLLPDDAEILRDIGYAFHRLRNYQEALRYLRQYLELAPEAEDAKEVRALTEQLSAG
jgi:tetratricopeptide (TPR) repeat protein